MNKQDFQNRAKALAHLAAESEQRVGNRKTLEKNREEHLAGIKQFDAEAAKLEQEFFAADDAFVEAELKLARYYASKIKG